MSELAYKELHRQESWGTYGSFGLQINVSPEFDDLDNEEIRAATWQAAALIEAAVMKARIAKMPEAQARAKAERAQLIGLFPSTIFVKEIPNGYCSRYCCAHLPWFRVTTAVGDIVIGWRKRVISIDWTDTVGTKTAEELFAEESVTKGEKSIHAWSSENARAYVNAILTGVPITYPKS